MPERPGRSCHDLRRLHRPATGRFWETAVGSVQDRGSTIGRTEATPAMPGAGRTPGPAWERRPGPDSAPARLKALQGSCHADSLCNCACIGGPSHAGRAVASCVAQPKGLWKGWNSEVWRCPIRVIPPCAESVHRTQRRRQLRGPTMRRSGDFGIRGCQAAVFRASPSLSILPGEAATALRTMP